MDKWPADKVERRPVKSLIPYAKNARTHSDAQVAQIAASMKEWGWTNPILIDEEGVIIAGHGRLLAAQRLGVTEAPVMVAEGWTEAQKRAYTLADNKLAINAGWNDDLMKLEFHAMHEAGFDVGKIGFSATELDCLMFDGHFEPGSEDEQGRLDQLAPKNVRCPNCGETFDSRIHEQN